VCDNRNWTTGARSERRENERRRQAQLVAKQREDERRCEEAVAKQREDERCRQAEEEEAQQNDKGGGGGEMNQGGLHCHHTMFGQSANPR